MFSQEEIKNYLEGKYTTQAFRKDLVTKSNQIKVHADGLFPAEIIDKARPNEPLAILKYRKELYKPKTKTNFGKILTLLQKITKAEDWRISYNPPMGAIQNGETLQEYCENSFPYFDSITNYFFSVGLKKMITDPNGVILVFAMPTGIESEYLKPFPYFFSTEQVLYFEENNKFVGFLENAQKQKIYYFADKEKVVISTPTSTKEGKITYQSQEIPFSFGIMPAIPFGGEIEKFENNNAIYQSFVSNALPALDELVRLYSDHQANLTMHIHPEKWVYNNQECTICKGTGKLINEEGDFVKCNTIQKNCSGTGYTNTSPFGVHVINPATAQEQNAPIPNVGYIQKPLETVNFLVEEMERQEKSAFSALGLEFLAEVGANQSGIAKEYDRSEINTFVFGVARHIVENILKPIYYFVNEWRYFFLTENDKKNNLPVINIPQKFDTLTSQIIAERLKNAVANGYDTRTIRELQTEYAKKEFGEQSNQWKIIDAVAKLNPMPNITEDDKMTILSNGGTSKIKYIISCNIQNFVEMAVFEYENFLNLDFKKQNEIITKYAQQLEKEIKSNIVPINPAPTPPNNG